MANVRYDLLKELKDEFLFNFGDEGLEWFEDAFNQIDDAVANSVLRERTNELDAEFKQWKVAVLSHLYDLWVY